jgi:hypothetical protein
VYNFGTFHASSDTLISDFMQGRLMYWVSRGSLERTLASYRADNRSIFAQKLELGPDQKRALSSALKRAVLPEHRYYRYDYYLNNCSTQVRDLVDQLVAGQLRKVSSGPARLSWREHTARLTEGSLGVYSGLQLALADGVDQPNTVWEEMFLPSVLADQLRQTQKPDGSPLVSQEATWFEAQREPPSPAPTRFTLWFLGVGGTLGAALFALGRRAARSRAARVLHAILLSALTLLAGALGGVLLAFWLLTDHVVAHHNENLMLCAPWLALVPVLTMLALLGQAWAERWRRWLLFGAVFLAALALCAKALPWFDQDNALFIALFLPLWAGACFGLPKASAR